MMTPKSSVAALWIENPSAKYFNISIGADQILDYASRKGKTVAEVEKYLSVKSAL